jgi:hypothetical protein
MASTGIIYSATGAKFIEEAIVSARSSLRYNHVPHLIFCDRAPPETLEAIDFIRFEPSGDPFLDKVRNIGRIPFDQNIYLDSDTYVTDNIEEMFDLLQRFDVAAAHAPGYLRCEDKGPSDAFNDFNTGVIAYRAEHRVSALLDAWAGLLQHWLASGTPFRHFSLDQAAFRRALWESQVSFYVLSPEYNYRLIFFGRLVGRAKILHGRSRNFEKVAARLNERLGPRIIYPVPPDKGFP